VRLEEKEEGRGSARTSKYRVFTILYSKFIFEYLINMIRLRIKYNPISNIISQIFLFERLIINGLDTGKTLKKV
jgi:hypothetical protein